MDSSEYMQQALRTESTLNPLGHMPMSRLLHASMGLVDEAAEFANPIKAHLFYGKPLDTVNLSEELGDMCWFMAIALDALGTSFANVMERNIAKLRMRYPDNFTSDAAINRDLDAERTILEQ